MLVTACFEVGVRQVDVTELRGKYRVGPKKIHLARPGMAGVERDLADVRQVLWKVAAPSPYAEHAPRPVADHVLDGHHDPVLPRLTQWPFFPALQRPARRWRMRHHHGNLHPARHPRDPYQGLFRSQPPGAAIERGMEGHDRDAVTPGEAPQILFLMGIPTFVHHDLDPVEAGFGSPGVHPLQAKGVEGARTEYDGDRHRLSPRLISKNRASVDGEWFW